MIPIFLFLSLAIICFFLLYIYKESFVIIFVIITFLTVPPEIFPNLRPYIQLIDTFLLGFLFFKKYGFDFKKYPVIPRQILYPIIILFSGMILSIIFSDYPGAGVQIFLRSTAFFIIIYFFYGTTQTQKQINTILVAFFLAGLILMGGVIVDFLFSGRGFDYLINPIRDREYGLNSNVNITGEISIILFPFIICAFFMDRFNKRRLLLWLSIFIIMFGTILIASRAALAGIIVGTGIVLFFRKKKMLVKFSLIVGIFIIGFLILENLNKSLEFLLRLNEGLSSHDQFWNLAVNIIQDKPLFGIGIGAYPLVEFNYITIMLNTYVGEGMIKIHELTMDYGSNNSHNFYLVMTSDMGILGLLFAISLIFGYFKLIYLTYIKFKNNQNIRLILIAFIAVGICLVLRGLVESNGIFSYGDLKSDLPFWLFVSILVSYFQNNREVHPKKHMS